MMKVGDFGCARKGQEVTEVADKWPKLVNSSEGRSEEVAKS